jgi:hypothetical protein
LDFQNSVDSDSLGVTKLSLCDDYFSLHKFQKIRILFLKLIFHWGTEIVEKLLNPGVPHLGESLEPDDVVHAEELNQKQQCLVTEVNLSEHLLLRVDKETLLEGLFV